MTRFVVVKDLCFRATRKLDSCVLLFATLPESYESHRS
jgi:hypothetical protein